MTGPTRSRRPEGGLVIPTRFSRAAVPLDRRRFLARSGAAAAALVLGSACAPFARRGPPTSVPAEMRLAPVRISPERVIRTVAGLRPYRAGGFVVRPERFGEKVVIHNYGHGGGGISLAWGSSELAVEIARATGRRRFAVLGCGIMGLTTARLLQDAGFEATIYAKDLPPHTTSNIGGGQWSPFSVFTSDAATPTFERQYERAARLAHAHYQNLVGPRYGVRWIDNFSLRTSPGLARGGALGDLFFDQRVFGPGEHPFHTPYVARFTTMIVEPNVFLPAVMDDFLLRGGQIVRRDLRHLDDVLALEEGAVVNCTGIGSRELFGDEELVPVKGELVVLIPQPEVDYITLGGGGYMFPRSDGIILGGSQRRGEWSLEPDPEVAAGILEGNRTVFEGMEDWRG